VVEPTQLKNMIVKMGSSSPGIGVDNKQKICELPPPRKISQFLNTPLLQIDYKLGWLYITDSTYSGNQETTETTIDPFIPSKTQSLRLGRISKVFLKLRSVAGRLGYQGFTNGLNMPSMKHPLLRVGKLRMFLLFWGGWCVLWEKNKIQKERC